MRNVVWFREDLRISDNPALYYACEQSTAGTVAIYIIDCTMWLNHQIAACRVEFILRGLQELSMELAKLNIPLIVHKISDTTVLSHEIFKIIKQVNAQTLFFNQQYEVNESERDKKVKNYLEKQNIACHIYQDQTILLPGTVVNQQGDYFKVFTAFKKSWQREFQLQDGVKLYPRPLQQPRLNIISSPIPNHVAEFKSTIPTNLWPAGEIIAQTLLNNFIEYKIFNYDKTRDFPAIEGTSKLSAYLATGMLSARQCFMAALHANANELDTGNKGAMTWMSELIWRDFYKHLLVAVPRISKHRAYKLATEKIQWEFCEKKLQAWQQGMTGYPIVDAAMRQLITTGWMHNRLRMVVAMFFSKNLFFDWRVGEQYFMRHLIDGDLAANNGGWQWCASTGTDAVPYFRIFNPIRQSERFDPQGDFIRQYCPELAGFNKRSIHEPHRHNADLAIQVNYPLPIVDIQRSRKHALATFKSLIT